MEGRLCPRLRPWEREDGSLNRGRGSGREGKASASYSGSRDSARGGPLGLGSTAEEQQEEGRGDEDSGIIAPHQSAVSCGALYSVSSLVTNASY